MPAWSIPSSEFASSVIFRSPTRFRAGSATPRSSWARSPLSIGRLLDTLHRAGVEIVSPTFMNQRQIKGERAFIPEVEARQTD